MSKEKENFFRYRNQLIVLNRYMPRIYRYSANLIWSLFYLLKMKGNFKNII